MDKLYAPGIESNYQVIEIDSDLLKYINAFITEDMSESLIVSTVNVNLKTKTSLYQIATLINFRILWISTGNTQMQGIL